MSTPRQKPRTARERPDEAHDDLFAAADPARRAAFLRRELARHDHLYFVEARPEISDAD